MTHDFFGDGGRATSLNVWIENLRSVVVRKHSWFFSFRAIVRTFLLKENALQYC